MPGIIVGVDGSEHSRHAPAWAMREAVQHHLPLNGNVRSIAQKLIHQIG
jgi:hypothetical protein